MVKIRLKEWVPKESFIVWLCDSRYPEMGGFWKRSFTSRTNPSEVKIDVEKQSWLSGHSLLIPSEHF